MRQRLFDNLLILIEDSKLKMINFKKYRSLPTQLKKNNTDSRISEVDARNKTKKCIMNLGTCLGNIACEGEIRIWLYREIKYSSETNQRRIIDDEIDSKRKQIFMPERVQYSTNRTINHESY